MTDALVASLVGDIECQGWSVTQGLFDASLISDLREYAQEGLLEGHFRSAGIGSGGDYRIRDDIRGDKIRWLDPLDSDAVVKRVFARMSDVKETINRSLFLGLFDFECHLACYDAGMGYERHFDRPQGSDLRRLTTTLYLNEGWRPSYGGQLRIYFNDDGGQFIDVEPEAGTCVFFLSEQFEHQVLPCSKRRFSLSGWFNQRPTR